MVQLIQIIFHKINHLILLHHIIKVNPSNPDEQNNNPEPILNNEKITKVTTSIGQKACLSFKKRMLKIGQPKYVLHGFMLY